MANSKNITLNTLNSLTNETSFLNQLNNNFAVLLDALGDSVYKNGTDSTLTANKDVGNNDIINLKDLYMSGALVVGGDIIDLGNLELQATADTGDTLPAGNPDNLTYFLLCESTGIRAFYWLVGVTSTAWVEMSFAEVNTPESVSNPVTEVSTNTTVNAGTQTLSVDASASDVTITLVALADGYNYNVRKANTTGGNVIIVADGSDTINGDASLTLVGSNNPSAYLVGGVTEWGIY